MSPRTQRGHALDPREVARAFGAALRVARTTAGISQDVLAERADCDRTYPSLLERGQRQPTLGKVIDLARALQIDPVVLVDLTLARLVDQQPNGSS
jgi:transcriptional regulator with XRE-family HTH domain